MLCKRRATFTVCLAMVLAVFLTMFTLAGCSLYKHSKGASFASDLKLRIAVLPFENQVGVSPELSEKTSALLAEYLSDYKRVVLISPEEVDAYIKANGIPLPLTQSTAVLVGRALGLNAVVTGSISEVSQVYRRTGWLRWFTFLNNKKEFVNAVLVGRVVEVASGTMILAETSQGEIQTGEKEDDLWNQQSRQGPTQELVSESLSRAVASMSETIEDALDGAPWKGFIVQVSDKTALLDGGQDVGIRPGDKFDVYSLGEKITNAAGHTYILPGPLQASLEASRVDEKNTELTVVSGSVQTGDIAHSLR